MRRMTLGRAGALAAITAALCLAQGGLAAEASAQEYYLDSGSVTVTASNGKQYVTQEGGATDELQTSDTVISQRDAATATANTVAVISGSGQTARVTLGGVNIDVRGGSFESFGLAAVSVSGEGSATVELSGKNTAMSGFGHAGVEKGNSGNLTVTAHDNDQGLTASGGYYGAGIGGKYRSGVSDITVSGGAVTAEGGYGAAGIGAGFTPNGASSASGITITAGVVKATGGARGAGIGGAGNGNGTGIAITGGRVTAKGANGAAGIGGGSEGKGADIAVSGGEVAATGSDGGAGIGCGVEKTGCSGVRVSGGAQLKVQGGKGKDLIDNHAGAGIGNGAHMAYEPSEEWVDGDEVAPDTSGLTVCGRVRYYEPGADMETAAPTKTAAGTVGSHSLVPHDAKAPTCTEGGYAYSACSQCDYTTYSELPATGHAFTAEKAEEKYLKSAATCTEKAVYFTSCSVCGESSKGTEDEVVFEHGGPLDHDWGEVEYTWSEDRSSCTARRTCGRSADHVEEETAKATAKVTQEKSCTSDELTTYTAAFENAAFATQTAKDVKTADATGHDFTAKKAEPTYLKSAATCTESAVYYTSCSVCGESSKGTEDEVVFEHGGPDVAAHGSLTHVAAKAATAEAEGNTEYWYCADCERYFSDAAGTKEIRLADTVVAKKAEPAKKAKKPALPTTGDGSAAQAATLLAGSLAALGAACIARRRAA